jgi:tRNA nucleotidyltransferase (CCA-adding enzyme)
VTNVDAGEALGRARAIAASVRNAGGRALIVGGWVRDRLMGRDAKDLDLEVYGLDAPGLRRLLESLGRVETVGESFQVYKIGDIDVALPRRESKAGRGHRGFDVTGDPTMPVEEAARRRDFTVNAIAWDPLTADYLDPFDGRGDIQRRLLRVVDPARFADDSLRVLRAVQLAARLDFHLDDDARELCRAISLDDLPPERVWGEIEKLLFAPRPSIGFALALELGVVVKRFPELQALPGCLRVGAHAAGRRPGPRSNRQSGASATDRRHAWRGVPRPREAGDDGGDRRTHPFAGS